MNIIDLSVPAGVSSPVAECGAVMIGYVGEGGVTKVVLDVSAWEEAYGEGVVTLGVQRSGDPTWYPVALTVDGTTAAWLVSKLDTNVEGMGVARFAYTVGGAEKRSAVWHFFVDRGLQSPEGDVPDPYKSWVERLEDLGAETLQNAQDSQDAADAAEQSATDAAGSAESAETAKNAAGDAAAAAGESARAAGENASTAQGAAQAAQNAAGAAEQSATVAEAAQQAAETAVTHYPKIVNDFWWVWDVSTGSYVNTNVKAEGEDGEGAVLSVNGKTGEVTLDAEDVGALPDSSTLDNIPDGATYKRPTAAQVQQIQTNAADIQTQGGEIGQLQDDVEAIEQKIPNQASSSNQLADKAFVNSSIQTSSAHFRGNWETWVDVPTNAALYPVDDDGNTTPTSNDYMVVQDAAGYPAGDDELEGTWRFKFSGVWALVGRAGWHPEYQVNETPLTAAQIAAINSGATAELIAQITANETAIQGKQNKITASGLLKGDGAGGVSAAVAGTDYATPSAIPSVPSAYTSNPAALGTASPGSSTSWARGDHVHPKPSAAEIGAAAAGLGMTGASVGQYVKVKTVDGNGKPLTWEAGTPSGGGGMSSEAAELLITILSAGIYTSSQTVNIAMLADLIGAITIRQAGTTLVITGVKTITTVSQSDSTLSLI